MYDVIKPRILNQGWGTYDPATYSPFGFSRHNGRDLRLSPSKKIYAPFDYTVVRKGFQPEGGGIFLGIISESFDFPYFTCKTPEGVIIQFQAGTYRILTDLLHLNSILVNEGDKGVAGDLLAIGDNTGKSTGEHCHQQDRRVTWDFKTFTTVDTNDANNSFDPTQFLTGIYAEDLPQKISALRLQVAQLIQQLAELIKGRKN